MIKRKLFDLLINHVPKMEITMITGPRQAEVDFVVQSGKQLIPIEVKYKESIKKTVPPSLKNFISKYTPSIALIANPYISEVVKFQQTDVHFVLPWSAEFDKLVGDWDTFLLPFPAESRK